MSKYDGKTPFHVGYHDYETKDEAVKEATRRALRDWEDVPVTQTIGVAKFDLSKLNPDLVAYTDIQ